MTIADISEAIENFGTVWADSIDIITGNPVLMVFLASGIVGTCFRIFRRARRAVV